jgi:hypothetical protein
MNDKRLTILIDGREALPVRAIPYVTEGGDWLPEQFWDGVWDRFPPRLVAEYLYLGNDKFGGVMCKEKLGIKSPSLLTAYQLAGNTPVLVQPREWKGSLIAFDGFEAQLKREYGDSKDGGNEANANWRSKAVEMLPEGVFVWLNEFETAFKAGRGRPGSFGRKRGDDGLNLAPMLPGAATRAMVMKGFDMPKAQAAHGEKQAAPAEAKAKVGRPKTVNKKANVVRQIIEAVEKVAKRKFESNNLPGSAADLLNTCKRIEKAITDKTSLFGGATADTFNTWLKAAGYGFSSGRTPNAEDQYWAQLCVKTVVLITPEVFTEDYGKDSP